MNIRARILACLVILSILMSLIVLSQSISDIAHDPEYTEYNEGIAATTGVYYEENWNQLGRLYLINGAGDVLRMVNSANLHMEKIHCIEIGNDKVYAIYSRDYEYMNDDYHIYRIAVYTPYLELTQATDMFLIDSDETVTSIDAADDSIFISTVGDDGNKVNVYQIEADAFMDLGDSGDKDSEQGAGPEGSIDVDSMEKPVSIVYREAQGGRFFVSAYYDGTDVMILEDVDDPTGRFKPDVRVKAAVDAIHFNVAQQLSLYSNYILWWVGGLLIWFIIMGIIYFCLRRRNRSLYVYVMTEIIYLILLASAFYFVRHHYGESEMRQNARYAILAMRQELDYMPDLSRTNFEDKEFYDSQDYRNLTSAIRRYMKSGYNNTIFYDIFIYKVRSGQILVGGRGYKGMNASFVYGGALSDLQTDLKNHERIAAEGLVKEGENMMSVGMPDDDPSSGYALVAICYARNVFSDFWSDAKSVLMIFAIVFLSGSLLIGIVFYLQSLDLMSFERSIRDVALGRTKIMLPETPAQDLKSMWNSLAEICKRMEEISYDKFRIFEAYYRFAPKNIETIMSRDSIFDVNNGDMVQVSGTLMLLNTNGQGFGEKKIKSLTNIMSYMNQYADTQEGILVSQDSSLSVLRFFFLEDFVQTVSRATQFLHRNASDTEAGFVSGFLYDDSFIYGVAGIKAQSLCFITSRDSREMEDYAAWLYEMRIPLVLTGGVAKREDAGQTRYIGFILTGADKRRVDLYEAIDAESSRLRQLKLSTREKFEETLNLFYSKEYYLARNRFTEILKECPEDSLAKWYLFESERYLNGEADPNSEGELRLEKQ